MRLYHGSIVAVRRPVVSRGRARTDFGKGFYTTTNREQAEKWAKIKKERSGDKSKSIVSVYEFDEKILNDKTYNTRYFDGADADWLNFVVNNRRGNQSQDYDLVMGPVANDNLYATISLFETGALSVTAAIEQLKTHVLFDQLSFHTLRVCSLLSFVESYEVEL